MTMAPPLADSAKPYLQIVDVVKQFGEHTAVNGVNLSIAKNEIFALLGSSGCGKSTLINALAGSLAIREGVVEFADEGQGNHRPLHPKEHKIGYIPQNGELEWVSAQGKIDNFMKSWRQKSRTERNENFFEEMEHNLFLLMKQMEKNENGGYQLWNR